MYCVNMYIQGLKNIKNRLLTGKSDLDLVIKTTILLEDMNEGKS